jgi:hypothetical protein
MKSFRSAAIDALAKGLGLIAVAKLSSRPDLAAVLEAMNGARSFGVSVSDSVALYDHVVRRRPRVILDLGAGQSSAAIAAAAARTNTRPRLVAVEESSDWLAHHRETIPANLLGSIELIQRDTDVREFGGEQVTFYRELPRLPYEFIHVDGPSNRRKGTKVSCDVIDLLDVLARDCLIVFDGREASARLAQPHLLRAGFRRRRNPITLSHEFIR